MYRSNWVEAHTGVSSATEAVILYRREDFGALWAVTAQFKCAEGACTAEPFSIRRKPWGCRKTPV